MMDMQFGEFTEEVKEVLEFVNTGTLLFAGQLPSDVDAVIIRDLGKIPTDEFYEEYGDDRMVWRDILGHACAEYFAIEYEKWPKEFPYRKFLSDFVSDMDERYKRDFPRNYRKYHLDKEIPGILAFIVHSRIVMGKNHRFFEILFEVFKSGGYPCGWAGNYPKGKLIVYYPAKK